VSLVPAPEVVDRALAALGPAGGAVLVEDASQAEVRLANNTVTTNGVRTDRRVTVVALAEVEGGTAAGVARRAGEVDPTDLARAALADAQASPAAEDAAGLLEGPSDPDFDQPPPATDLGVLGTLLDGLPAAFERARAEGHVLAGFAEHERSTLSLGLSTGLRRRHVQPTGAVQLVARDPAGTRSAWVGRGTPDFADLTVDDLHQELATRLSWAERSVELPAGRYEVVLPPSAVTDLMAYLSESAGGRDTEEGRTVFSRPGGGTRVGETLSPLPFSLRSDPAAPGLECAPFLATPVSGSDVSVFDNGLPLEAVAWIGDGTLQRLRYHRAGASRAGVPVGPPVDNLRLELPGAGGTTADLVARTGRGLLLTCLWYIREVDPATLLLTGLTRDGVYLVEDGRVTGAVNNFRFNESPVDLLGRATEAGATERSLGREFGEWLNRTATPALRIPDFNMSSVSPAS
jgi:predicted Zn-dependent protease